MKVYKFGGASLQSAEGIRNIVSIVGAVKEPLFVVVSAMGKTTNAMELVLEDFMKTDIESALLKLSGVETYHAQIVQDLFSDNEQGMMWVQPFFDQLRDFIVNGIGDNYDKCYDRLVSYGELLSSAIVSAYLIEMGVSNTWLDMRKLLVTDSNYREANVKMEASQERLMAAVSFKDRSIYIGQGFIGANLRNMPTTLGREGSDYTAAIVANLLDAESVTIWKDVPGILNADPRIFDDTVLIPELSYLDAVELAFSGAQIIHPKTIKPLENKGIPLFVRPFNHPLEAGSVIRADIDKPIDVPVLILRKNQVLITMRPRDFSFVLEDSLSRAFSVMNKHRLRISLIQSSAISISVCVDNTRYLAGAIDELGNDFKLTYNDGLELLTIRAANAELIKKHAAGREVLLSQRTRRSGRLLMRQL